MGCRGAVRRAAAVKLVELVFSEEQQALARAGIFGLDLPRDGGGPGPTDLQNAIARRPLDALRQGVCLFLIHATSHLLCLHP